MKMDIRTTLILKSGIWEILSAILTYSVIYVVTGQSGEASTITLILLVLKSILLAMYDYYSSQVIQKYLS